MPHCISNLIRLNEGISCPNNQKLYLSYFDQWTFFDLLPPQISMPLNPINLKLSVSIIIYGNVAFSMPLDYFVCGMPKIISRSNPSNNLCFLQLPPNVPYTLLFSFKANSQNLTRNSPHSMLFYDDKIYRADSENPSFMVPKMELICNSCFTIRFLIYNTYYLDLPCFIHI